ncbi:MAG: response regulator transcription factor [Pseudomonadota bacterium]
MVAPIVIADDHPLMRGALRQAVHKLLPEVSIEEADTLSDAVGIIEGGGAQLLLLDIHMNDSTGFAGLASIRQRFPAIPIIVVSASDDDWVIGRAARFGASGFIPKSSSMTEISDALDTVLNGDLSFPDIVDDSAHDPEEERAVRQIASLTPALLRVLSGLTEGKLNKQIAYEMDISEATVKAHVTAVFRKLEVINRTQAVLKAKTLLVPEAQVSD